MVSLFLIAFSVSVCVSGAFFLSGVQRLTLGSPLPVFLMVVFETRILFEPGSHPSG